MEKKVTLSVIGLGILGAPMAACLAAKGFPVIGADVDARKVDALNRAQAPVFEPRLPELLQVANTRLKATQDIPTAVLNSEVTFVVVPTPSEPDDRESNLLLHRLSTSCGANQFAVIHDFQSTVLDRM